MFVLWSWRVILFVFSCGTMCNINTVGCQICFIIYACQCVYTCLCLCMLWPSHPSKHLIQCFQPLGEVSVFFTPFLCCLLPLSSLVSCSAFFSLHSSPGGDYEWHDNNVSTSCSDAHRPWKNTSVRTRETVSAIAHRPFPLLLPLSPPLSAGRWVRGLALW